MKRSARALQIATMLAVAACVLGAVAASAVAAKNIEPLNTKFTGKQETGKEFKIGVGNGGGSEVKTKCSGITLTGTTNATKTKFVNAVDSFSGCSNEYEPSFTVTNKCAKEGTVPWTVTLGEPNGGTLKLNCALVVKEFTPACEITAHEQTVAEELSWSNLKSPSQLALVGNFQLSVTATGEGCEAVGFKLTKMEFLAHWLIPGLQFT